MSNRTLRKILHQDLDFHPYTFMVGTKPLRPILKRYCCAATTLRNGLVPKRDTINRWVHNFKTTASAINPRPKSRPRSVRTPASVEKVRQAVTQSPQRSVRKRAAAV
ncbi:unnamed protein product [Psylliodes chrysocephalus]|uniref:DUF4817 domain-containing protein n=1 Tax=Psylliodes chrysocephalus TaxID=3402493 RepID=A0A9P0CUF3_9CUCU|nr:unnamed protein product [Psylliodes chrysocephala]